MMSVRDKEALYSTKEEGGATNSGTMTPSSSRQWSSGLKNPRIVRVSRTFGGKDRHSKVCTIKGLRDRRIRLSVPTAIQLYDLQDRLGLGQPSKVIDWLLDTTKHDIDKLPPLPPIPGSFDPFNQHGIHISQGYGTSQSSSNPLFFDSNLIPSRREGDININSQSVDINEDPSIVAKLKYWDSNTTMRSKQKEIIDHDQRAIGEGNSTGNSQVLAQNFFPIASSNNASILAPSTFLSNHHPMYNYYHWEPSSLSLTQLGNHGLSSQNAHPQGHSGNSSSLPSPLALSSGSSQLFLSPSMASASTHFPNHHASFVGNHPQLENDIRQFNRSSNNPFPSPPLYTTSSGLGLKPFPFSMSHHPQLHQSDDGQQHDKNNNGPWKESSRNE